MQTNFFTIKVHPPKTCNIHAQQENYLIVKDEECKLTVNSKFNFPLFTKVFTKNGGAKELKQFYCSCTKLFIKSCMLKELFTQNLLPTIVNFSKLFIRFQLNLKLFHFDWNFFSFKRFTVFFWWGLKINCRLTCCWEFSLSLVF